MGPDYFHVYDGLIYRVTSGHLFGEHLEATGDSVGVYWHPYPLMFFFLHGYA